MLNAFQVDSDQLRSAAASVEGCCEQLGSGWKSDAAGGIGAGMAGFSVASACESASEKSGMAFEGVVTSWRAWSDAAAGGATGYEQIDATNESVIRGAGSAVVV